MQEMSWPTKRGVTKTSPFGPNGSPKNTKHMQEGRMGATSGQPLEMGIPWGYPTIFFTTWSFECRMPFFQHLSTIQLFKLFSLIFDLIHRLFSGTTRQGATDVQMYRRIADGVK